MGKDLKPKEESILSVQIREERMKNCIAMYKRRGTMTEFIETFRELSASEKALFFDDAMVRAKGLPPKKNPFKKEG